MRVALVAAFAFPAPQGSQWFLAEQARALQAAGCSVTVFSYGHGDGRDFSELACVRTPADGAPQRIRAGFDRRKPRADLDLARLLETHCRPDACDAVLAHNAEAAFVARYARLAVPRVYVAHTRWREELGGYLPLPDRAGRLAGRAVDALAIRGSDALLTLSPRGERKLAPLAEGPTTTVLPPFHLPGDPAPRAIEAACRAAGLQPGGYLVYAGNLDFYQNLAELEAVAELAGLPVVVVTHDARGALPRGVRVAEVETPENARLLVWGARMGLLPRRRAAGFPIKLLSYMEAGLPIVARADAAGSLIDGSNAQLVPNHASFASAVAECLGDPDRCARLGAAARSTLAKHHAPADIGARLRDFIAGPVQAAFGR